MWREWSLQTSRQRCLRDRKRISHPHTRNHWNLNRSLRRHRPHYRWMPMLVQIE